MSNAIDKAMMLPALVELIRRTSSDLPEDVEASLRRAIRQEARGSAAQNALRTLVRNVAMARESSTPICQDTGTNIYFVAAPVNLPEATLHQAIVTATRKATRLGYLRHNVVDSLTGQNTGDNVGRQNPLVHFHQHRAKTLRIDLMLKGGGCENVSIQYALPVNRLFAGRDLPGVGSCIVDAAHQAQGRGCSPGILGVGIGGDRMSGYAEAKRQLLRPLDDKNPEPALAKLEHKCLQGINSLGIGPMGFGGKTTALGVKIGVVDRIPASYFVSVAYMCWACRRRTLVLSPNGRFTIE
jgi:fumarate hydratase class I